ncbi:MAG TPA: glycosyl hydrolase family 28-related protein [Polyangiaceae bacterium]
MRSVAKSCAWLVVVGCVAVSGACGSQGSQNGSGTDGGSDASSGSGSGASSGSSSGSGSGSGAGSSSGTGSSGSSSGGSTCDGGACNQVPPGLLDPDYTTTWNPGILSDKPTGQPLGPDYLPVRTTTCASVPVQSGDATSAIQNALNGCMGKNQVVTLAAGTYSISATIQVPSGVVLRGAGSGGATATTIVSTKGGPVLAIGTLQDGTCYDGRGFDASAEPLLTQDAKKETSTVMVADGSKFAAGDVALVDQLDDADVSEGDCTTIFKRTGNYGVSERVEISAVSGNTLTLTTPLHWTFKTAQKAQIAKVVSPPIEWAGIEHLLVQGGRPGSYPGQNAGGIDVSNAAYSWVKDVQIDGTTSGMPIRLAGTYRCVVRDSHFHNSYSYGFAQDNYGIVLACGAADDLVENNVTRFVNKPVVFNNSGGGNVVGYNYADNSWSCDGNNDDGFQEVNIDCHCAFPHMELMEGNWAPHVGASTTHGNAGYLTYFRNYASSQWSPSKAGQPQSAIIWSQPFAPQYANVTALDFPSPDLNMTVIGNVLGSTGNASLGLPADLGTTSTGQGAAAATSQAYTSADGSQLSIFLVDQTTVSWTSIWLTGNFDTVNAKVMWNASALTANLPMSTRNLPASLYYATKPRWWPSGHAWPWVGPDIKPMVGSLPAEALSKAFDYYTAADASCTLNCGSYCCSVGPSCSL